MFYWCDFCTFAALMLRKLHAAVFVLALSPISVLAQHVYVDLDDSTITTNNSFIDIDVNQDSAMDFRLTLYRDTGVSGKLDHIIISPIDSLNGKVVGSQRGQFNYVDKLQIGHLISLVAPWNGMSSSHYGTIDYRFDSIHDPYSQWQAPYNEGFVGTRTIKRDSLVFGWIRLSIAPNGKSFTVYDCGYQSTLDSSISAGHLWVSVPERSQWQGGWALTATDLVLTKPHANAVSLAIMDIQGRVLLQSDWQHESIRIPRQLLGSGMLIVLAQDREGAWVQRIPLID